MKGRQEAGDDAYAGSYRYARARSPGRKQFAQQHAPPEYSPSGLHEGAEKDAWAPDKKTRFESMSSVSFRDDPKKRGTVSQGSPHERWRDREQLSGDLRPGLTHLRRLEDWFTTLKAARGLCESKGRCGRDADQSDQVRQGYKRDDREMQADAS